METQVVKRCLSRSSSIFKDSEFSLLAIDLPGHGGSENAPTPEQNYTIPGYAQLIDKAIKRLGIGDYILVGWSLGGNIALELAGCDHAQANPKLKAIMIFGAPPVGPGMDNIMEAFLPATFEHAVGQADASADEIKAWVKVVYGTLDPIPPQFLKCTLRTDGIAREIMFTHWASGESGYKQIETVVSWQKPICVLHGSQDAFASLDYLKLAPWNNLWRDKIWEMPECGPRPIC